jgi:hypothetical protein
MARRIAVGPRAGDGTLGGAEAVMRKIGMSAGAVLVFALPVWAQDTLSPYYGGYPGTGGYPAPSGYQNYQPGMYVNGFTPDAMPAYPQAPDNPMMRYAPALPNLGYYGPQEADPYSYPFDPNTGAQLPQWQPGPLHQIGPEAWVRAEWLFWHITGQPVPPLIASGNAALPNPGVPGGGNYTPLVGPTRDYNMLNGARLYFGRWFDPDGELGYEVSGFIFARQGTSDFFQNTPGQTLGVPVLSTTGALGVYNFSVPGQSSGSLGVTTSSQLLGADAAFLHRWYTSDHFTIDGILGYRYMLLNESLDLYGRTTAFGPTATYDGTVLPVGTTVFTTDTFRANTQFHGGLVGTRVEAHTGAFTFDTYVKGAIGANIETLNIGGNTQATGFGVTQTTVGGLRALPSNYGREVNTDLSGLTEFGVDLGVKVCSHVSLHVGYNLLYWTNVLRPGNAIDPVANVAQIPIDPTYNPNVLGSRPIAAMHSSDLLANGLTVGIEIGW